MQEIKPIIIDCSERLEQAGDTFTENGHVPLERYVVGGQEYRLDDGFDYDVALTHTGDGILVTGIVRARAEGQCDRCLDPASFDIAGEVEEYFLFEEPVDEEAREEGFELVGENHTVDLAGPLGDAVVMETPFVLLCKPDCAGLCPVCGCNLNRESCDCAEKAKEAYIQSDENPFAALKNLKLDD